MSAAQNSASKRASSSKDASTSCVHFCGRSMTFHLRGGVDDIVSVFRELSRYDSTDGLVADLFTPGCDDCNDVECHHDYPDVRYRYNDDEDELEAEVC